MGGASTGRGALGGAREEPVEAMWAEPAQPEWVGRDDGRSHPAGAGLFSLHQPQHQQDPLCGSQTCS